MITIDRFYSFFSELAGKHLADQWRGRFSGSSGDSNLEYDLAFRAYDDITSGIPVQHCHTPIFRRSRSSSTEVALRIPG